VSCQIPLVSWREAQAGIASPRPRLSLHAAIKPGFSILGFFKEWKTADGLESKIGGGLIIFAKLSLSRGRPAPFRS